jgi:endonuclease G
MRFILFSILLFLQISVFSQLRDSVYVQTAIFNIVYSEKLQQPKWVEYTVLCHDGKISRKGLDFYPVKGIVTSTNEDYENNIYDKGHLAPAADFNCNQDYLKQTFSYLNCVLQHEKLNRGAWRLLESHERELAKQYKVSVEIRMYYSKNSKVLTTGATIPDSFTKTIMYNNKKEKYFFKNEEPKSSDYNNYKVK